MRSMPKRNREWLFGWRCSLAPGKARVRRTSRGFLYQFFLRLESGKTYGSVMPLFQKDGGCRPCKCISSSTPTGRERRLKPVTVSVQIRGGGPKNHLVDFSKKIWYNIYRKIKKDTNSDMHLQNIWYKKCLVYMAPSTSGLSHWPFTPESVGSNPPGVTKGFLSVQPKDKEELILVGMDYY